MSKMTRLTLLCRGATTANRKGIFGLDEALAPDEAQAAATVFARLRPSDRLVCAPEESARSTAAAHSAGCTVDGGLADVDYGAWRGRTLTEVAQTEPDALRQWLSDPAVAPHGGESIAALHERTARWLQGRNGTGGHMVAVTHAAVIRVLVAEVLEAPLGSFWKIDPAPLTITELRHDGRRWSLHVMGAG